MLSTHNEEFIVRQCEVRLRKYAADIWNSEAVRPIVCHVAKLPFWQELSDIARSAVQNLADRDLSIMHTLKW